MNHPLNINEMAEFQKLINQKIKTIALTAAERELLRLLLEDKKVKETAQIRCV